MEDNFPELYIGALDISPHIIAYHRNGNFFQMNAPQEMELEIFLELMLSPQTYIYSQRVQMQVQRTEYSPYGRGIGEQRSHITIYGHHLDSDGQHFIAITLEKQGRWFIPYTPGPPLPYQVSKSHIIWNNREQGR